MLVYLHSWSGDYRQRNDAWQRQAQQRGWIYLHPNFRGPNQSRQACGSKYARQDVLDAIDQMRRQFEVDPQRIYLAGSSGGGHMAMLMAGHHPDRFTAVSAWVGISDLAAWYRFHVKDGVPQRYAKMIVASLGGPPTQPDLEPDYRDRSPIFHLQHARKLPLDIWAGVEDGHTGSVPITHSLNAFNVIAQANGDAPISAEEIKQLTTTKRLQQPRDSDRASDDSLDREIHLRRSSGSARVTIFAGGHEGLAVPACHWLSQQAGRPDEAGQQP
jgi:pimeloyl-ACP methyl ester carboxylesterase